MSTPLGRIFHTKDSITHNLCEFYKLVYFPYAIRKEIYMLKVEKIWYIGQDRNTYNIGQNIGLMLMFNPLGF